MARTSHQKAPTTSPSERAKKTFADLVENQLSDPTFRAAWEALEPKRRVVSALLRLRAAANLTQKELAKKAGWHPAFVSRLESFPREGEKLYMPDLATLETYAAACGCQLGLVFGRPKGRGARLEVAATAGFGDHQGLRRAMAGLSGCEIALTRGGTPRLTPPAGLDGSTAGRPRRR